MTDLSALFTVTHLGIWRSWKAYAFPECTEVKKNMLWVIFSLCQTGTVTSSPNFLWCDRNRAEHTLVSHVKCLDGPVSMRKPRLPSPGHTDPPHFHSLRFSMVLHKIEKWFKALGSGACLPTPSSPPTRFKVPFANPYSPRLCLADQDSAAFTLLSSLTSTEETLLIPWGLVNVDTHIFHKHISRHS